MLRATLLVVLKCFCKYSESFLSARVVVYIFCAGCPCFYGSCAKRVVRIGSRAPPVTVRGEEDAGTRRASCAAVWPRVKYLRVASPDTVGFPLLPPTRAPPSRLAPRVHPLVVPFPERGRYGLRVFALECTIKSKKYRRMNEICKLELAFSAQSRQKSPD